MDTFFGHMFLFIKKLFIYIRFVQWCFCLNRSPHLEIYAFLNHAFPSQKKSSQESFIINTNVANLNRALEGIPCEENFLTSQLIFLPIFQDIK